MAEVVVEVVVVVGVLEAGVVVVVHQALEALEGFVVVVDAVLVARAAPVGRAVLGELEVHVVLGVVVVVDTEVFGGFEMEGTYLLHPGKLAFLLPDNVLLPAFLLLDNALLGK